MSSQEINSLALCLTMATAAGLVGCFAVMRRMTLAADAISHIALPGLGVALLLRINPMLGALAMLLFGAVLIWALETQTRIATETITGVVFSVALAVGTMTTSGEELIEALFGRPDVLALPELIVGLVAAVAVISFILVERNRLVIALVSPEIALTSGIDVRRMNLLFLLMFALTVALGLRYLGVLLMGSLIIIPAATARHVARNLTQMLAVSVIVAVASTMAGTYAASVFRRQSGPCIVAVAGAIFFLSLLSAGNAKS
ncbi:MAG: metal ABC transporter permease [Candidatus Binataceae bacterium]